MRGVTCLCGLACRYVRAPVAMTANRRHRPRTERRSCGRSTALLACLGCVVQRGTGFIGHVPRAPSIPGSTSPSAVHRRSWPTTATAAAREGREPRRDRRVRPGGALGAGGGPLLPSALLASSRQQSSSSGTESLRVMMLGPQFAAASPARRPTTALNAAADSGSSSGGKAEATSGKPIRRRGPGRKTLAAARNIVPVPAATKAASYAIAQAASAGRAAAVEAMEREDADREALNVLAGEQRKELRASVAAGRGPSVLVSREGFEPVDQTPPQPQRRERPQRQPEPEPEPPQQELVEEEEEEEKEEEEEDEDDEDYDDEDEDEDEDDEDEDGEPRAKRKTKEELDKEEARQDALAANIQKQGLKVGAFGKERIVYHHDYLVHEDLGFCRFLAPEFTPEAKPDEILLEFSDMNLAINKDQSHLLTRYRTGDAARVPLSVVSDQNTWLRHKIKVQERVTKQAVNVMDLYAKRARVEREPCKPDGPEMMEFCKGFDHTPTKDQLRCLVEIENDMVWRKIPMDRLLCGDVGFGKTEVALRAMFRMVRHKKQVALLAPTTILAAQHYRTLLKRMPADVNVALLRGGNSMGSRGIKEAIKNETVHVVVGTHSLLSRKVEFPNLGLLVIDEEQKFGVNQKEKLKVLTTGVDVLTLTATPIPRTLHMSLTGIRDLSTIFSPPANRQNVTTYIMKGTDEIVQRALTREMSRGGQVFYVVPRINQIEEAWQQISRCLPDARVAIGHSKVKNLEDVVLQFTLGRGDVLLATSIIENGIDMPNVNSIVVMDSHMFGLSQLYQMRGRVGRSDVAAYTYLLYPPGHQLSNEAKRRLKAMRELSHLGSGFELANRDLEIRGAGNIFGTDQSGDLKDIGYELYMNMLEKAIVSVRGTDIEPVLRCEVDMGFGEELKGSVPADYMTCDEEERERQIDRLRVCNSFRELVRIAKEWVNAYSEMPVSVRRLFKHTHLNTACRLLGVNSLSLEFLPERDASLSDSDGEDADEASKGWTGGGGKKPMVEDLEAARESHAAQNRAEAAAAAGAGSETVEGKDPAAAAAAPPQPPPVNGRKAEVGTPKQVVKVGGGASGGPGMAAGAAVGGGSSLSPGGKGGDREPVEMVPFAVMRGPEVEQERWEILFRQGPMEYSQLEHVSFRGDVGGVAIRCPSGKEEAWLKGDREEWLDHLLSLLLPLVEYVETKQSLQMKSSTRAPPQFVA